MWVIRQTDKDPEAWPVGPHWLMEFKKGSNVWGNALSAAFVFSDETVAENLFGMLKRKGENWDLVPLADEIKALEDALAEAERLVANSIPLPSDIP